MYIYIYIIYFLYSGHVWIVMDSEGLYPDCIHASLMKQVSIYKYIFIWGFPKMVVFPNNPNGFPTKNHHFGVEIRGTI